MLKFVLITIVASQLALSAFADEIAVTIYSSNLGVVSELRSLDFDKGAGRIAFRDVPSGIDATSVRFEAVERPGDVTILEQNYAFDLVRPEQLYAKYIDKKIELIDKEGKLFSGTLLAYASGSVTLSDKKGKIKIVSMGNISEVNFPSLPDGLITRPTLFWLYQSDYVGALDCRVGYQTTGLNWSAEYVGVLDESDTKLGFSGWSSINNTSGKTYKDAKLKLVAGDINRVASQNVRRGGLDIFETSSRAMAAPRSFEEKAFFEYRLYTLPRPATLANNEIKQISLFEPAEATVEKILTYRPDRNAKQIEVAVKFENSEEAGLGMPLPAGRVRIFKADDDGSLILLGEDRIGHTPKDEELKIVIGKAFDIVGEQKITSHLRVSKQVEEQVIEIELRNHKSESVNIAVEKQFYGYWEILESSLEYEQKDATHVLWDVEVAADSVALLKLKVRHTYPNR